MLMFGCASGNSSRVKDSYETRTENPKPISRYTEHRKNWDNQQKARAILDSIRSKWPRKEENMKMTRFKSVFLLSLIILFVAFAQRADASYESRMSHLEWDKAELKLEAESLYKNIGSSDTDATVNKLKKIEEKIDSINAELSRLEEKIEKQRIEKQRIEKQRQKTPKKSSNKTSKRKNSAKAAEEEKDYTFKEIAFAIIGIAVAVAILAHFNSSPASEHSPVSAVPFGANYNSASANNTPDPSPARVRGYSSIRNERITNGLPPSTASRTPRQSNVRRNDLGLSTHENHDGRVPIEFTWKESSMNLPAWIARDPEKMKRRLIYEHEEIKRRAPLFKMMQESDGEIYFEGKIITRSKNIYSVKIYPSNGYPYAPPESIIMDSDVKDFCLNAGMHDSHNYGASKGGVKICVIKPDGSQGIGWDPTLSMVSAIVWAAEWLHAYEVKRVTGRWILPE